MRVEAKQGGAAAIAGRDGRVVDMEYPNRAWIGNVFYRTLIGVRSITVALQEQLMGHSPTVHMLSYSLDVGLIAPDTGVADLG